MKVKQLYDRYHEHGLTGEEEAVQVKDWENRPSNEDYPTTYLEEWDVLLGDEHLGCIYDDGDGYRFAEGYHAGYLDY